MVHDSTSGLPVGRTALAVVVMVCRVWRVSADRMGHGVAKRTGPGPEKGGKGWWSFGAGAWRREVGGEVWWPMMGPGGGKTVGAA